jgi:hypothetical protein
MKTPTDYLAHYIRIARLDKAYAWWAVNELAKSNPQDHIDLPRLLTEAMKSAKSQPISNGSQSSTPASTE